MVEQLTLTERWSGAQALIAALETQGIKYLFGVPGHGAYPIYDALNDFPAIRPVVGRNEQGAIFAADGYSRVTDDVAVATSVPRAGVTNALTGLWEVNGHGSRLLYLLEYDPVHQELLRPVARYYHTAFSVADVAPAVHRLIRQLRVGRPGLAVLEVPNGALHSIERVDPRAGFDDAGPAVPDDDQVAMAAAALSSAKRPIICASGSGWTSRASQALTRLAETLRAPVLIASTTRGVVADDHPLCLGVNWDVGDRAERLLSEADVVLGIGPRAGMLSGRRAPEVLSRQLIHLDWDGAEQGPSVPARIQISGYLPSIIAAIADHVEPRAEAGWATEALDAVRGASVERAEQQIPWAVPFFKSLRDALPRDALLFTDSLAGLWAARLFPAYEPNSVHFPWFTGTLGHGIPAAVGAAMAFPDRTIVALAGDGAFLYNSQELAAMKYYRRKIIAVVANDDCFSAILFNTAERFGRSIAYELANPDFVKLGEAYGMRGIRLTTPDDVGAAVREAVAADGASLIEIPLQLRPPRL
ncbi:MAG: thiamine pyrophosphate-binding protein [Chloroflexota bacterium]